MSWGPELLAFATLLLEGLPSSLFLLKRIRVVELLEVEILAFLERCSHYSLLVV